MTPYCHVARSRSIHNKRGVDSSTCDFVQDELCGIMGAQHE